MSNAVTVDRISPDVSYQLAEITQAAESHPVAAQGQTPWIELAALFAIITKYQELFGLTPARPTWAKFSPPKNYYKQPDKFFRNTYASAYFNEDVLQDIERLIDTHSPTLTTLCNTLRTLNEWVEFATCCRLRYAKG
ncbi:MAG: hypothetical protein P0S94_03135 [Simkaniaceae bacterium]|nr:hypothetical protein [Simkaniaceae bacterium]